MGTSKNTGGGTTRPWSNTKLAATNFVKSGGSDEAAKRMLGRLIEALGGTATALAAGQSVIRAGQRTGGVLSGVAASGLDRALEDAGLGDLVGRSRFEVLGGLADYIAGEGSQLDDAALRDAVVFVLHEYLPPDLGATDAAITQETLEAILRLMCARYIYRQCEVLLSVRLDQLDDQAEQARLERRAWTFVRDAVEFSLMARGIDVLRVNWLEDEGRTIMEEVYREVLRRLETLP